MTTAGPGADRTAIHFLMPGHPPDDDPGRALAAALGRRGHRVTVHHLPGPYPEVDEAAIAAADQVFGHLPDGCVTIIDSRTLPGVAGSLWLDSHRLHLVALVHRLLVAEPAEPSEPAVGAGGDPLRAGALRLLEQGCLARVARVVTTCPQTAAALARLGIAEPRLALVEQGDGSAAGWDRAAGHLTSLLPAAAGE